MITPPQRITLYMHNGCTKLHFRISEMGKCTGEYGPRRRWLHSDEYKTVTYVLEEGRS